MPKQRLAKILPDNRVTLGGATSPHVANSPLLPSVTPNLVFLADQDPPHDQA